MLLAHKILLIGDRKRVVVNYDSWLDQFERVTAAHCTVDQGTATVDTIAVAPDGRSISFFIHGGSLGDLFNVIIEADTSRTQIRFDTISFSVGTNGGPTVVAGNTGLMLSIRGPTGPTGP